MTESTAVFHLAAAQEAIWLQQREPWLLTQIAIRIDGALNKPRLVSALNHCVATHEILRTAYVRQPGIAVPFQSILPACAPLVVERETTMPLQDLLQQEQELAASTLDLQAGPLLRVAIVTTAADPHTLVITTPSLTSDTTGLTLLVSAVARQYSNHATDAEEEILQYADIAQWQKDMLAEEEAAPCRDFWTQYYRRLETASDFKLPLQRRQASSQQHRLQLPVSLPAEVQHGLSSLAALCNTSIATVSTALWGLTLLRLGGGTEMLVGCLSNGRHLEELQDAFGRLDRMLPLQLSYVPSEPTTEFLRHTAALRQDLEQWQDGFLWTDFVASSKTQSDGLQTSVAWNTLPTSPAFGDSPGTFLAAESHTDMLPLQLCATQAGANLSLSINFDSAFWSNVAAEQIAASFGSVLAAACSNPQCAVGHLPLLTESQTMAVLAAGKGPQTPPQDHCIHALFEHQAETHPDRTAVRCEDVSYTYAELNRYANRIAHRLRALGVGPGKGVGIAIDRSADLIAALLGVLKAGGMYIPLGVDVPRARLEQQLHQVEVLLLEERLRAAMPALPHTLAIDSEAWDAAPDHNPVPLAQPEDLAYVLYTSGSTGTPKGVAVRHRNLVNYSTFIVEKLALASHADGLQFATVSTITADLGNTCLFPSLISGSCLHVLTYDRTTDAALYAEYVRRYPIDVLKIVPSHLRALLQADEAQAVLPRRFLILGGEALHWELLHEIQALHGSCTVLNHYGPTETTVGSLACIVDDVRHHEQDTATVPIGFAIANTQLYVLDAQRQLVPNGVSGELYVGGAGVTAGYWNDASRTAERFVPDPFCPGATLYRTGDLVRRLSDGAIEFLGRSDDQLKIRGFRVEPGEVEASLNAHEGVQQAIVVAREDRSGEKQLVAYVVLQRDSKANADTLRSYLQERLPAHMVPSAIVLLPRMPLNANGKVDRKALPAPEHTPARALVPPSSATEVAIHAIWAEVLRRERVSVLDNFFDLGGHSLMATQVISRMRRALQVDLPLRLIFEEPTIRAIALVADRHKSPTTELPPLVAVERTGPLPLSFAQQRLWLMDQMEPNNPLYNIPRRVRMRGALDIAALQYALDTIAARHEALRTRFVAVQGEAVQVIDAPTSLTISIDDLSAAADALQEARSIATAEAVVPFSLAEGPLLRARLLRLASDDHIFLLTMHHIVSDAWSAGVFLQELSELYDAKRSGRNTELPELSIQYADYAAWQRKVLDGERLTQQLRYWQDQLRGAPALLNLPGDRPRPAQQTYRGGHETIVFPGEVASALRTLALETGTTLFMTMLAGFQLMLSRYSNQEQVVVGTDLANRTTTETERLIGFFINLLALRLDLSGNPTYRELLDRTREAALGAYAHQEMPFEKLVEVLQPERSLSHHPLVQVLFVMQNLPRVRRELSGLTLEPFELPITRSKFDLAVFVTDGEQDLTCHWLYSTDLFDAATIHQFARSFQALLRNAVAQPEARIHTIEMMTTEEKQQAEEEKKRKKQSQLSRLKNVAPVPVAAPPQE
ncbi:MAG: amino acid adenylation domain-containing protein [Acidobacteriota bacterium]|nr:amino acid adenylation domain-containing protein [Acidobacteriota bacterium]